MNICLTLFLILLIFLGINGFHHGLMEEVNRLISLVSALLILSLGIMIYMSFRQGEAANVVISVVLLLAACLLYRFLHFVVKVIKDIMEVPLLQFLNQILGLCAGVLEAIAVLFLVYTVAVSFPALGEFSNTVLGDVENSTLLRQLNSYNYLAKWIQSL